MRLPRPHDLGVESVKRPALAWLKAAQTPGGHRVTRFESCPGGKGRRLARIRMGKDGNRSDPCYRSLFGNLRRREKVRSHFLSAPRHRGLFVYSPRSRGLFRFLARKSRCPKGICDSGGDDMTANGDRLRTLSAPSFRAHPCPGTAFSRSDSQLTLRFYGPENSIPGSLPPRISGSPHSPHPARGLLNAGF